ncbi:MAG: sodium:proton antiporter [Erysipelotrichaceae bacterium]|nr:sodium:proton antiporter [Erysipelotrichaceae bacterium]
MIFMFFVFFFAWIIFNGKFTLELALFGVFFSVVLTWFMVKYLDYQIQNEIKMIKKIPLFLQLLAVLVLEVAKANEQLLYWIFSDKYRMEPAMVVFTVDLKKSWTKALLANFITLTPGTITEALEDNVFSVHCLDRDLAEGIEDCAFVRILKRLEEE